MVEKINSDYADVVQVVRPGFPDFSDFPWQFPLSEWANHTDKLIEAPRGVSRHVVVFAILDGIIYAFKELPLGVAAKEYNLLLEMEQLHLPSVIPVGFRSPASDLLDTEVLITRYLEFSLPYRSLFMSSSLVKYREHLLDAMAGLLVQLHLAGVYWGDCSLSNALFKRDAGALQAYLVDAETSEIFPDGLPAGLRFTDIEIMEENIDGGLYDLRGANLLGQGVPVHDTGAYVRLRYHSLWDEINRTLIINPGENFRIHERIRALNELGFSVGGIELSQTDDGDHLRMEVLVTDRNFHRDQLITLTGVEAGERQARQMMNEIQQTKAVLSRENNRSTPLSAAAYYWLDHLYGPIVARIKECRVTDNDLAELYCQVLEHKWYLSERAGRDVGHQAAVEDYLRRVE